VRASRLDEGRARVRKALEDYALWDEARSERIVPILGDLAKPLIGLTPDQFQMLADTIDAIYHNGALVNFLHPYSVLKPANVLGTQEVLRLASARRIKSVQYISTLDVVSAADPARSQTIDEHDPLDHPENIRGGYAQSKWVAERLVQTAGVRGIPVSIYRPGRITGHSETGICNTDDFFCRMLKGCIQLRSAPDLQATVEMIPVDFVSKAIVHLSMWPDSASKVFHLLNPHPIHFDALVAWLHAYGYPVQLVAPRQWQEQLIDAVRANHDNALRPLIALIDDERTTEEAFIQGGIAEQEPRPALDAQNTISGLADISLIFPPVDETLLKTYFAYFIRSHFLEKA
jgi:thioester reductase-like protein